MASRYPSNRGFTLLELLVVVGTTVVLAAVSLMAVQQALPEARANAALRAVKMALVYAREQALTERRSVEVTFDGIRDVRVVRLNLDGTRTGLRQTLLEGGVTFQGYAALPDTPDAFGNSSAVTLPNNRVVFTAEGTAIDATGLPVSGTVFLGIESGTLTARAVTLFGATGRVMGYRWDGRAWVQM